jgi:diguanylate cyclase (GGDEF)-like protein
MGVVEPMMLVANILSRQAHGTSLHPLSQLPPGPSLRQASEMRLGRRHGSVNLVYIDLDHFKSFNDRYGFIRGDAMIRTLAEILRHVFVGRPDRLLGHIGGDDFILLLDREEPTLLEQIQRAIGQFHALASHLYDPADVARGYFTTDDGARHPIASISVACVNGSSGPLRDSVAAAERAAYLKKVGKAQWGSVVVIEGTPPTMHAHAEMPDLHGWESHALRTLEHLLTQPRSRDPHAMDHVFKAYPFFEMLFELDAEGRQRYPNWINPNMYGRIRAGGAGTDRSGQPYFTAPHGSCKPYVSAIYLSTASEDFCLTISVPITDDQGGFVGVLVGDLNLASMASLLDRRED